MIRLFISHSSEDVEFASLLVQLLSTALGLRAKDIRCTSLDGYRLPGGADFDEQLREEALAAEGFVGIVSPQSMSSAYVLFELGARWGARKHLIPLLAPGLKSHILKGPLKGLNALSCDNMAELHQLIGELANTLNVDVESPAAYQRGIDAVIYHATTSETPFEGAAAPPVVAAVSSTAGSAKLQISGANEYAEAEAVITQHCEREWPDDYSMRAYCVTQQRAAVAKLIVGAPAEIPADVFTQIRRKCAREWPDDYAMRQYSEDQQLTAYRRLQP
jgi:hypothetical protein